jgi:hypothetical protein
VRTSEMAAGSDMSAILTLHGTARYTTGNAAFAVRSNLCRASFIERTAKSFVAVRRPKRTATNLCRASYFTTHGKESLPCVLITDARQRFFFLPPPLQ